MEVLLRRFARVSCRVWRLVTGSIVLRVNFVAVEGRHLEIHSAEFDDVAHTHHLLLVVGEEVFEDLVDGAFLPDDEPHGPVEIHIVFFVFIGLSLFFRLFKDCFDGARASLVWDFAKVCLVEPRLIINPETAVLVLHHVSQHNRVFWPQSLQARKGCASNLDSVASHQKVRRCLRLADKLVVSQVFKQELLVVVLLLLVDVEVLAVEVEEAVRQLVAGKRAHNQCALVPMEHAAPRDQTSRLHRSLLNH